MAVAHRLMTQVGQQIHGTLELVHTFVQVVIDLGVVCLLEPLQVLMECIGDVGDVHDLQIEELNVLPLQPLFVPLLLDDPKLAKVVVLLLHLVQLVVSIRNDVEDFKAFNHVFFSLAEFLAVHAVLT